MCQDIDSLKHLAGLLQVTSDQIQTSLYKDCGLVPAGSEIRKVSAKNNKKSKKDNPLKRWQNRRNAVRRVGVAADRCRRPILVESTCTDVDENVVIDGHTSVPDVIYATMVLSR